MAFYFMLLLRYREIPPDMKRLTTLLTISVILLFASCSQRNAEVEYFAFRSTETDFWGMMSPDGEVLVDGKFMFPPHYASQGVFLAQEDDGMYGFYTADKKLQRINDEHYVMAQPFRFDNYTAVCREGDTHFTIIDTRGREVASLPDSIVDIGLFSGGLAPFVIDDIVPRMGYIDSQGRVAIAPHYSFATNFLCGVALVEEITVGGSKLSVITPDGIAVYTFDNSWRPLATEYSDGLLPVIGTHGEIAFLDTHGKIAIAPSDKWRMCRPNNPATVPYTFKAGRAIFSDGFHYGLIDKNGRVVVPAQYLNIYLGEGGLFVAENKDHRWGCIDSDGNVVIPFEHLPGVIRRSITPHTIVMQNEAQRYRLVNHKGDVISKPFENYQIK